MDTLGYSGKFEPAQSTLSNDVSNISNSAVEAHSDRASVSDESAIDSTQLRAAPPYKSQRTASENPDICLSKVVEETHFPSEVSAWWSGAQSKINYSLTRNDTLNRLLGEYQKRLDSLVRYQQKKAKDSPVSWLEKLPSQNDAAAYINKMVGDIEKARADYCQYPLVAQHVPSPSGEKASLPVGDYPKVAGLSDQFTQVEEAELECFITETLTPALIRDMHDQMSEQNWAADQFDAAGGCIVENNNNCWLRVPAGLKADEGFSGYKLTFPKGRVEGNDKQCLSSHEATARLLATAIRETFEETGLLMKPTCFIGGVEGSATQTAYFLGQRAGGDPVYADFETETVSLKPLEGLSQLLELENKNPCLGIELMPKLEKILQELSGYQSTQESKKLTG